MRKFKALILLFASSLMLSACNFMPDFSGGNNNNNNQQQQPQETPAYKVSISGKNYELVVNEPLDINFRAYDENKSTSTALTVESVDFTYDRNSLSIEVVTPNKFSITSLKAFNKKSITMTVYLANGDQFDDKITASSVENEKRTYGLRFDKEDAEVMAGGDRVKVTGRVASSTIIPESVMISCSSKMQQVFYDYEVTYSNRRIEIELWANASATLGVTRTFTVSGDTDDGNLFEGSFNMTVVPLDTSDIESTLTINPNNVTISQGQYSTITVRYTNVYVESLEYVNVPDGVDFSIQNSTSTQKTINVVVADWVSTDDYAITFKMQSLAGNYITSDLQLHVIAGQHYYFNNLPGTVNAELGSSLSIYITYDSYALYNFNITGLEDSGVDWYIGYNYGYASDICFDVPSNAMTGSYYVTLTGESGDGRVFTGSFTFIINEPGPTFSFAPDKLEINRGESADLTIYYQSLNQYSLTIDNLPTGASWGYSFFYSDKAIININIPESVNTGSWILYFSGRDNDNKQISGSLELVVHNPPMYLNAEVTSFQLEKDHSVDVVFSLDGPSNAYITSPGAYSTYGIYVYTDLIDNISFNARFFNSSQEPGTYTINVFANTNLGETVYCEVTIEVPDIQQIDLTFEDTSYILFKDESVWTIGYYAIPETVSGYNPADVEISNLPDGVTYKSIGGSSNKVEIEFSANATADIYEDVYNIRVSIKTIDNYRAIGYVNLRIMSRTTEFEQPNDMNMMQWGTYGINLYHKNYRDVWGTINPDTLTITGLENTEITWQVRDASSSYTYIEFATGETPVGEYSANVSYQTIYGVTVSGTIRMTVKYSSVYLSSSMNRWVLTPGEEIRQDFYLSEEDIAKYGSIIESTINVQRYWWYSGSEPDFNVGYEFNSMTNVITVIASYPENTTRFNIDDEIYISGELTNYCSFYSYFYIKCVENIEPEIICEYSNFYVDNSSDFYVSFGASNGVVGREISNIEVTSDNGLFTSTVYDGNSCRFNLRFTGEGYDVIRVNLTDSNGRTYQAIKAITIGRKSLEPYFYNKQCSDAGLDTSMIVRGVDTTIVLNLPGETIHYLSISPADSCSYQFDTISIDFCLESCSFNIKVDENYTGNYVRFYVRCETTDSGKVAFIRQFYIVNNNDLTSFNCENNYSQVKVGETTTITITRFYIGYTDFSQHISSINIYYYNTGDEQYFTYRVYINNDGYYCIAITVLKEKPENSWVYFQFTINLDNGYGWGFEGAYQTVDDNGNPIP